MARPKGRKAATTPVDPEPDFTLGSPGPEPLISGISIYTDIDTDTGLICKTDIGVTSQPSKKPAFSDKEQAFLDNYLCNGLSKKDAMIAAGYGGLHPVYRRQLAAKLIKRYEEQAGGAVNVLRNVGLGETEVARKVLHLMNHSSSEKIQLSAAELAAKCLRMTQPEAGQGQVVNIVINTSADPTLQVKASEPGQAEADVVDVVARPTVKAKALQITR